MRLFRAVVGLLAATSLAGLARAGDMTWTFAVQLAATVSTDPARVELRWTTDPFPVRDYAVYRKGVTDASWGEPVILGADALSFTDENVEAGRIYEYQVIRHAVSYTAYGYIAVGLDAPLVDTRGRVILVVDRSIADPIAAELRRLETDLAGDGWTVVRRDVARDASPADIKAEIRNEWQADRERTKSVLLFGHIPVVRSGNQNVDGHQARPMPADVFYGEMDGDWTDANGDGIYDPSTLPSDLELMVGRVDFADLPGQYSPIPYPGEVDLLRRYLDKDHAFRHATVRPAQRALVGNAVGDGNGITAGQAYAASGYRNFAALVGAANVVTANADAGAAPEDRWMARLSADDYLWAYGCGAGSDFSIGALGSHGVYGDAWASDFLEKKPKGTFYLLFGSWFVDWAKPDNIMRTSLAGPDYGLAACYSGRPHVFLHHMGVGEPIGYGMRISQNNAGLYQNQVQRQLRGVHLALLGDPTLRMHQLAPPRDVAVRLEGNDAVVTWSGSTDKVLGYHLYRASHANGPFTRLTESLVGEMRFVDHRWAADAPIYMVRAVTLQSGPSGSFYNASQGITASLDAAAVGLTLNRANEDTAATNPADVVWFDDTLPTGAIGFASENDRWNWIQADPAPFSGGAAHQGENAPGLHHHFFGFAAAPLNVGTGDTLFAYVQLDPNSPPREIMLTWLTDSWEQRAYWGDNLIGEGTDGSPSRWSMGPLPRTGRWVRLEVPAAAVGLENQNVSGMGFTAFDGRATWDRAGKSHP